MSEIRTNMLISGESSEYRSNMEISIVTLNSTLVDTHSSFRTNLDISTKLNDGSISSIKTNLELNNVSLRFNLVDMTKLNQSVLYFSKFFNMYFEPEVMWNLLAQGTNEQINISHLSNALSIFSTKVELAQTSSSINAVGTSINQHALNSNIHLTQEEKTFISEIMNNPPWFTEESSGGGLDIDELKKFLKDNGYTDLLDYWTLENTAGGTLRTKYNIIVEKGGAFGSTFPGGESSGGGLGTVILRTPSNQEYISDENGVVSIPNWVTSDRLNGLATESWILQKNYLTQSAADTLYASKDEVDSLKGMWSIKDGKLYTTYSIVVEGGGAFGSDVRYKDIINYTDIDLATIANAPLFTYKWNDREDKKVYLGTSAQYWMETTFKDAVNTSNPNFYHLDYGALGVGLAIATARKVVDHEERIATLEKENKELKEKLNKYEQIWHN